MPQDSVKRLYDLQELDWRIAAARKSLVQVNARLADDSALMEAANSVNRLRSDLADRERQRAFLEAGVQEIEGRIKGLEDKAYGGLVTRAREYEAFEGERDYLQRQKQADEDELLGVMLEIDGFRQALGTAEAALARVETQTTSEHDALLGERQRLEAELTGLSDARSRMAPEFGQETLAVYDSLLKSRNGHAVARVERGMCQGCRVTLPTMELQRARGSHGLARCGSCGRILYVV